MCSMMSSVVPRTSLRHILGGRGYSSVAGTAGRELESKQSSAFLPDECKTYSNGLLSKETLDRFHPHVGNRDAVGYGWNGRYIYGDSVEFPYPSIRFSPNTQEVMALRQKERGNWSELSMEEKKALYRASFCNNFAEIRAPTGYWKDYLTSALVVFSLSIIISLYINENALPVKPIAFSRDWQIALMKRRILLGTDNIELMKDYDYEKNEWKN